MKLARNNIFEFGLTAMLLAAKSLGKLNTVVCSILVGFIAVVPLSATQVSHFTTETNTDFYSVGTGGMFQSGFGILSPRGIPQFSVSRVYLYWHQYSDTIASANQINLDGSTVTGASVGFSGVGDAYPDFSQTFRADVTNVYRSDDPSRNYAFTGTAPIDGVSMIIFYQDGNSSNNRDVYLFDGDDNNYPNGADLNGWNATPCFNSVHVGDGQCDTSRRKWPSLPR